MNIKKIAEVAKQINSYHDSKKEMEKIKNSLETIKEIKIICSNVIYSFKGEENIQQHLNEFLAKSMHTYDTKINKLKKEITDEVLKSSDQCSF